MDLLFSQCGSGSITKLQRVFKAVLRIRNSIKKKNPPTICYFLFHRTLLQYTQCRVHRPKIRSIIFIYLLFIYPCGSGPQHWIVGTKYLLKSLLWLTPINTDSWVSAPILIECISKIFIELQLLTIIRHVFSFFRCQFFPPGSRGENWMLFQIHSPGLVCFVFSSAVLHVTVRIW